jgi:hypothetical protein
LAQYGGGDVRNAEEIVAEAVPIDEQAFSVTLTLPPLAVLFIERIP